MLGRKLQAVWCLPALLVTSTIVFPGPQKLIVGLLHCIFPKAVCYHYNCILIIYFKHQDLIGIVGNCLFKCKLVFLISVSQSCCRYSWKLFKPETNVSGTGIIGKVVYKKESQIILSQAYGFTSFLFGSLSHNMPHACFPVS